MLLTATSPAKEDARVSLSWSSVSHLLLYSMPVSDRHCVFINGMKLLCIYESLPAGDLF